MKRSLTLKGTVGYSNAEKRNIITVLSNLPMTAPQFPPLQHFLFHFSHLQFIAILLFLEMIVFPDQAKTGLCYFMQRIINLFILTDSLQNNYTTWIFSFFLICVWLYLLLFLLIFVLLWIKSVTQIRLFSFSRCFLDNLFKFHFSGLFWIVNMILIIPLSSSSKNEKSALGLYGQDTNFRLLNSISLVLNYFFGVIIALFCYEPFKGHREYATHTSSPQVVLFLAKATLAPLVIFLERDSQGIGIFLGTVGLLFSILQLFILMQFMPYYSPNAMKSAISWSVLAIWISIVNIVVFISFSNITIETVNGVFYLELLMIPFCIKLAREIFNNIMKYYMSANIDTLMSETLIFKKLLSLSLMIQNMKIALNIDAKLNEFEVYFLGDLTDHSKSCIDKECICHMSHQESTRELKNIKTLKEKLENYKEKRVIEILSTAIEGIRDNHKLKLTYANMILQCENVRLSSALSYLYSISQDTINMAKFNVNSRKEILLKIAEDKLDNFLNSNRDGVLNLKAYIDFHIAQVGFKDLLLSNTKKYLAFWTYYKEPNFKMTSLYKKSQVMEAEAARIESLWNSYMIRYPHFYSIMGDFYCIYQKIVRNMPYLANKTAKKYAWKLRCINTDAGKLPYITEGNLPLPDTVTFYVSITREKAGKIQYASSNIEAILGYTSKELLGKNITTLMLPSLIKDYDRTVRRYLQETKSEDDKNYYSISGYVKNKRGYFSPMSTYVTIFPYVQKELTFMGVLRVSETPYEHIILNEYGYIDGFTREIGRDLGLSIERLTSILEICPDFSLDSPRKSVRILNLVTDLICEETQDKDATELKNKSLEKEINDFKSKSFTILKSKSTTIDEDLETSEETNWRPLLFAVHRALTLYKTMTLSETIKDKEKEYISYDTKIVTKKILKKKFRVLLIKPISNEDQTNSENHHELTKKENNLTLDLENESDVPYERPETLGDSLMSPNSLPHKFFNESPGYRDPVTLVTDNYLAETEGNLLSSTRNNNKKSIVLSPKNYRSSELLRLPTKYPKYPETRETLLTSPGQNLITRQSTLFDRGQHRSGPMNGESKNSKSVNHSGHKSDDSIDLENEDKAQIQLSEKASSVVSNGENQKIEQAVYTIPQSKITRNGWAMMLIFLAFCIGALINFVVYGDGILKLVHGNINILNLSGLRINEILFIHRFAELITLLQSQLILNNRFEKVFFSKMQKSLPGNLQTEANYLRYLNGRLRNFLNETDTDLLREMSGWMIPMVWEEGQVVEKNNFDAVTEIVMRSYTVKNDVPGIFERESSDVNFILDNSLNKLLITSENIDHIIIEDNKIKLGNLKEMALILLFIIFLIGAFFFLVLVHQQRKFMKNRKAFIDLLLRLDEDDVTFTLNRVAAFETVLGQNRAKPERLRSHSSYLLAKRDQNLQARLQQKRISKRQADLNNINRNQYFIFTLGFVMFIAFLVPFFHTFFLVLKNTTIIEKKLTTLIEANNGLYRMMLLAGSFYTYVRTDGNATVRNQPINEEWERLLKETAYSQDLLINELIYYQKEKICSTSTLQTLEHLILGNLCNARPLSSFASLCPNLPYGLLSKGIQGLNSFSIKTLSTLKVMYDISPRTTHDVNVTLNQTDLITLDLMIATFQSYGYISLQSSLRTCTNESIDDIKDSLVFILICYISISLVLIPTIVFFLLKKIEQERVEWRKIFRKIPIDIILTNKWLKHQLAKESNFAIQI